jgi:geranylgeranyl diphosphate synthase type II
VKPSELDRYLAGCRTEVDAALRAVVRGPGWPAELRGAMRYALLGPGKRVRPILALAAAETVGGAPARKRAIAPACAVEMIHAYSLVHDDLPAMDDDELRRGRPTLHVRYGEAQAILAGDALLTQAFEVLAAAPPLKRDPARGLAIVAEVAGAAGAGGMVAGQVVDLASEGRRGVDLATVAAIHRRKTGALIRAAVRVGAIAGRATPKQLASLSRYGEALGLAFQIADDILDEVGSTKVTGKRRGGDAERGKATYPALLGLDGARKAAERAARKAERSLEGFGPRAMPLAALVRRVVGRAA